MVKFNAQNPPVARFAAAAVRLTLLLLAIASVYYLLNWQSRLAIPISGVSLKGSHEDTSVKTQLAALLDRLPFLTDKHENSNILNNLSNDPKAMQSFALTIAKEVDRLLHPTISTTTSSSSSTNCPVCIKPSSSLSSAAGEHTQTQMNSLESMETIGWRTGTHSFTRFNSLSLFLPLTLSLTKALIR